MMMQVIKRYIKPLLLKRKYYFLITSHGNTASLWLAAALNQYPDVFCTHAYDYPFPANGIEPRDLSAAEQQKRNAIIRKRLFKLSLAEFLHEMQSVTKKPIVGNVHGYTYGRLLPKLASLPHKHRQRLIILNMVRHPITRVNSMSAMYYAPDGLHQDHFVEVDFVSRCAHLRDYFDRHYADLEYTPLVKAFFVALIALEDITRDVVLANSHGVKNISFEKVTSDPDYFAQLLNRVVNPYKALEQDRALSVFRNTPKINKHNADQNRSAETQYHAWEPWQRDLFNYVTRRMYMQEVYAEYGYQLAFS